MMFVTFALTFLTLKDEDRSATYALWLQAHTVVMLQEPGPDKVLLNLYQALFLTDSDGAESISGIDIGHQQSADFGFEMYTGDGSELLLTATTMIMLFATSIFSLVLLSHGCKLLHALHSMGCACKRQLRHSTRVVDPLETAVSILNMRNLTIGMYTKYYELQDLASWALHVQSLRFRSPWHGLPSSNAGPGPMPARGEDVQ